jgi:hypothetical protein
VGVQRNPCAADTRGARGAGGRTDLRPPARAQRKRELAAELWSLALVPAAFAAFVAANGGVVVGDRAHHAPVAHWAQPLYALLFAAAAFAPVHFRPRRRAPRAHARIVGGQEPGPLMLCVATWCFHALAVAPGSERALQESVRRAPPARRLLQAARALAHAARARPRRLARAAAMAVLVIGYGVRYGTLAHPFLLADNRCAAPRGCSPARGRPLCRSAAGRARCSATAEQAPGTGMHCCGSVSAHTLPPAVQAAARVGDLHVGPARNGSLRHPAPGSSVGLLDRAARSGSRPMPTTRAG